MNLSDFQYELPEELIAQHPIKERDHSRLLVLNKKTGAIEHKHFYDLLDFLEPGDILVLNNSKVIKARLFGKKKITHGKVEILLHREYDDGEWDVIGKNLKIGSEILFDNSTLSAAVLSRSEEIFRLRFNMSGDKFFEEIDKIGIVPLPPYIKRDNKEESDKQRYQTVFAKEEGSVAAPTAGLHLTEELIKKLKQKGINIAEVTLHVGLGTFAPITAEDVIDHKMHSEYYTIIPSEIEKILNAKRAGHRVIAVGTTSTRVLETIFSNVEKGDLKIKEPISGWTNIYIYPGYKFKCVDGLVTNFHLPKTSLLLLVSALAGREKIMLAYKEAVEQKYRFFSYGDAMLII